MDDLTCKDVFDKKFILNLTKILIKDVLILVGILSFFLWVTQYYKLVVIPTSSMYPTLHEKDIVIADVRNMTFKRGEILGFLAPEKVIDKKTTLIKRVVGLPGETVEIKNGITYIDDIPLQEPYIYEKPAHIYTKSLIFENSYFMLGDNRNNSYDSSHWGSEYSSVPKENFKGKIVFRIFPFSRFGKIE